MSLALFTICLIFRMHGGEAAGGLCKTSERSVPGKALERHTFKEFAVMAIVESKRAHSLLLRARTPVKTTPGGRVTISTFRIKCAS